MNKILLLNGGGIDSCAQLVLLIHEMEINPQDICSLHIDYGQNAAAAEVNAIRTLNQRLRSRCMFHRLGSYAQTLVPGHALMLTKANADREAFCLHGRNLMLASIGLVIAANLPEPFDEVMLALNKLPEYYSDNNAAFVAMLDAMFKVIKGNGPALIAPYIPYTKDETVKGALKHVPDLLDIAHTCYRQTPCGICPHCVQKAELQQRLSV